MLVLGAAVLVACSSSPTHGGHASSGRPLSGGTATLAEGAQGQPNYIFPFLSLAFQSDANIAGFNAPMYAPLYWFGGNGGSISAVNTQKSLADPPVYSDHDRVVTITLKDYKWSDGVPVTSRDLLFFVNLAKANKSIWSFYIPGHFPDNVISYYAHGPHEVVFHLNRSYNPTWFTDDELSLLTPLPQHVWDRTTAGGKVGNYDTTASGARAVYRFLNSQAKDQATYDTNPLWKVVDGPWRLKSFVSTGALTFVPNRKFSGPDKPHLSVFKEVPFTGDAAEFSALASGHALSVGYLPTDDLPAEGRITNAGYHMERSELFQINFIVLNFNNPTVGPIVRQLYVRQALQDLMDQNGQVRSILHNQGGYPVYGPIPPKPPSPYLRGERTNPYPFSVPAARKLLTSHGWQIPGKGPARCVRPGSGGGECGAGIPAGRTLTFKLAYPSGASYLQQEMATYQSDAARAGVTLQLSSAPFNTLIGVLLPCKSSQASCHWQLGTWGAGFAWSYPAYPSGEELFATGSFDNSSSYSSPTADHLIEDTLTSSSPQAMVRYAAYIARQLPVIWQIATYTLNEVSNRIHGVEFNPLGYINAQDWYFTK